MIITYGTPKYSIDITDICFTRLNNNGTIMIPFGDHNRSRFFGDPCPNVLKSIYINNVEYKNDTRIKINNETIVIVDDNYVNNCLENIHSKLKINYGNFNQELPEQRMVARYFTGNEKVLELGGNIGRNSLIIGSLVNDFVVLEPDTDSFNKLSENKNMNNLNFFVENSALSKRNLIQQGWHTIESDVLLDGYTPVNIISLQELNNKYNINFNTLVIDCEGAFYWILLDFPEILNGINLIIVENDYIDISHKEYIDNVLNISGFYVDYSESGGWAFTCPYSKNFFEVWKRN
jgi:FkbM family methyltransferase